jgi:hypothetical protein
MNKFELNEMLFGTGKPAGIVKLTYLCFFLMLMLCAHGIWVDVVPVEWLAGPVGMGLALLIGFVVSAALFAAGQINGTARAPDNAAAGAIMALGAVALLGAMAYPVIAKSLPWAHAAMFGESHSVEALMRNEASFKKRSCDYRLHGGPLYVLMGEHLCTSAAFHRRYPDRMLRVRLHGQRSALGFRITHFEVIEAPRSGQ